MVRLVHSLKGVAGNLGFNRLSGCAQQCEKRLKTTSEPVEIIHERADCAVKAGEGFYKGF